ncbi:oxaloacetate decarboxylase [Chloroflexota bacterium]
MKKKKTAILRELLARPGVVIMPMCYDGVSARLIEQTGFDVVGVTGSGVAASMLGASDVGLLTMTEMVWQAHNIAKAVSLPVVCDAETGYGNPINVMRCIREFEAAGVAGIYFEDQVHPKKCGHFRGKMVIDGDEMVKKIEAACDAREDKDFLIIARTDSRAVLGIDEAIRRGNAYARAGADVIYVEAPESVDEMKHFCNSIDAPQMFNVVEGGKSPLLSVTELEQVGYKLVSFSNSLMRTGVKAMQDVLNEIKRKGATVDFADMMISFEERNEILGLARIYQLEERYMVTKRTSHEV